MFYDTETTGTPTRFDQILQFAAIRTDDNLNVVDPFEVRSKLNPHIITSPGAMNVTDVSTDQLYDPGIPSHFEM
ncbi:MAG: exodeoxyribonuclease I, partial [Hyphomicrobiales bacterium]|nr:exodeoxyribonuclease I [Hyphomicrobiales bacterium]